MAASQFCRKLVHTFSSGFLHTLNDQIELQYKFHFSEWKEKYDMVDDDQADLLEYRMTNTFIFRPDLSAPLTGKEIITTVHPLIMGMTLAVNVDKKPLLGMTASALNAIFHNPSMPFWTGPVMDLLFDGFDIDCSSEDFAAKATCAVLASGDVQAIRVVNETSLKFSLMGGVSDLKWTGWVYKFRALTVTAICRQMQLLWEYTE